MIERPGDAGEHRLVTFRTTADPLEARDGFSAVCIADHRAAYLEFEGDIGGGRGRVRRVWSVWAGLARHEASPSIRVTLHGPGLRRAVAGMPCRADLWAFRVVERGPDDS